MKKSIISLAAASAGMLVLSNSAFAADLSSSKMFGWASGQWKLIVGVTGLVAPDFDGGKKYLLSASPIISLGKAGPEARFTSRNDNISISLYDSGAFRAGINGKIVFARDSSDADQLRGMDDIPWGAELGGFAEAYPTDWLRVRGEIRQGIRSHDGIVVNLSADAFTDVTPTIRISGGPRLNFGSSDYYDTYFGVTPSESASSGFPVYKADGGLGSAGIGGAVAWQATEQIATSVFAEYVRLLGPAADSPLVTDGGSPNQLKVGVSAAYRFDFNL